MSVQDLFKTAGNEVLKNFNPKGKQGTMLLILNAVGMVFAAASNTFAIAADKNTKPEDKKILLPQVLQRVLQTSVHITF